MEYSGKKISQISLRLDGKSRSHLNQCVIVDYKSTKFEANPYWTSVRRKKVEVCGWGPRLRPKTVLQLNYIFRLNALLYRGQR